MMKLIRTAIAVALLLLVPWLMVPTHASGVVEEPELLSPPATTPATVLFMSPEAKANAMASKQFQLVELDADGSALTTIYDDADMRYIFEQSWEAGGGAVRISNTIVPLGSCDTLTECAAAVEEACSLLHSSAERSQLAERGSKCDGRCDNGTVVTVTCVKARP